MLAFIYYFFPAQNKCYSFKLLTTFLKSQRRCNWKEQTLNKSPARQTPYKILNEKLELKEDVIIFKNWKIFKREELSLLCKSVPPQGAEREAAKCRQRLLCDALKGRAQSAEHLLATFCLPNWLRWFKAPCKAGAFCGLGRGVIWMCGPMLPLDSSADLRESQESSWVIIGMQRQMRMTPEK